MSNSDVDWQDLPRAGVDEQECKHDWELKEDGYTRRWSTTIDEDTKTVTAVYTGSEDWSEDGDGVHLECLGCGRTKPVPEDFEVVYE